MDTAKQAIDEAEAILSAATALCGDRKVALTWFSEHQIADFGGATPSQLYATGKTQMVLDYIDSLSAGATG
jgi:hypothetical protein